MTCTRPMSIAFSAQLTACVRDLARYIKTESTESLNHSTPGAGAGAGGSWHLQGGSDPPEVYPHPRYGVRNLVGI
jgi:hypothetical protein